jgi:AraC-like DNA-binding protein
MSGVLVNWNDPPAPETLFPRYTKTGRPYRNTLGSYHAGQAPNCRCYPETIVDLDLVTWPARVYRNGKITLRRQHVVNTLWNMDENKIEKNEIKINVDKEDNYFITHFREVIESRLDNSNLSIEDLAADMNLSRVQLYRKVKSVTNMSPVELLRTARLNRAYQLLITTKKTVSEIAYAVGFSAPSYFTKCFKEEYGVLPNDVR